MNEELISVIVPAFNVDRYLEKCLFSIAGQTYKNLEIIVVDDGSSDSTLSVAKAASDLDDRIKVYSKANSGVSDSRNFGLDKSSGEYIVFVDADDYLDPLFIEHLYVAIKKDGTDFSFYLSCFRNKNEKQIKNPKSTIMTAEDTLAAFLSPNIVVGCWNKLYKKEVIEKNCQRFRPNLFYGEGLEFITSYAQKCLRSSALLEKRYYYRKNNNFSATTFFNVSKYSNGLESLEYIKANMTICTPKVLNAFKFHLCMFYLTAHLDILKNKCKKKYSLIYTEWRSEFLKMARRPFSSYKDVPLKRKIIIVAGKYCPHILAYLDVVRKKREFRKSV